MHNPDKPNVTFKILLWIYALFYMLAGFNHFISTTGYYAIMPEWLPAHKFLIHLSGILEMSFGIMLLFSNTRKLGAWLIMLMLIAFMPAHIYMIQKAPFMLKSIEITPFIAWMRIPFQAVFIWWAWIYTKK